MRFKGTRTIALLATTAALVTLSACSSPGGTTDPKTQTVSDSEIAAAMKEPTDLVVWSWEPQVDSAITAFEKKYPAVTVKAVNVGVGAAHYQKLRAAMKAGEGAPDVGFIEYEQLPSFVLTNSFTDLAPYGADKLKTEFSTGSWNSVQAGSGTFALPTGDAPMGFVYRRDLLAKAGITEPPATWAEFAADAKAVKEMTGSYLIDVPSNEASFLTAMMWQAGVQPYSFDGEKTVSIDFTSAGAVAVLEYWQGLISDDLVGTDADFTDQWTQSLAGGEYAGWLTASWAPTFLTEPAASSSGNWMAAPLPQQEAGQASSAMWGGGGYTVLKSSKHPIAAYEFIKFLATNEPTQISEGNDFGIFPVLKSALASPDFASAKSDFFGGQQINEVFAESSATITNKFAFLPFMDYAYGVYSDTLGKAISDRTDLQAGAKAYQDSLIKYAKEQGFTVK